MRLFYKIKLYFLAHGYVWEEGRIWDDYFNEWTFQIYIYKKGSDPKFGYIDYVHPLWGRDCILRSFLRRDKDNVKYTTNGRQNKH